MGKIETNQAYWLFLFAPNTNKHIYFCNSKKQNNMVCDFNVDEKWKFLWSFCWIRKSNALRYQACIKILSIISFLSSYLPLVFSRISLLLKDISLPESRQIYSYEIVIMNKIFFCLTRDNFGRSLMNIHIYTAPKLTSFQNQGIHWWSYTVT